MTELATEHTDTATDDGAGDPTRAARPARPTPNGAVPCGCPAARRTDPQLHSHPGHPSFRCNCVAAGAQ
ncbi:hypothetical protein I553_10749 [Mycobacterium xenopi 4042]|uniref:Uncharacterized protein n=1 Tax=Mycobacterium xenopi 4042 TaxID=1299334 RepID=X8D9Z7_MYCXE|nr:hypothetical protein I553_10749 [Mycobacterium xenopi 4042]